MKKWLMIISAAATMSLVAACGDDNAEDSENAGSETSSEEGQAGGETAEMPEPDLEDVPDVVAEVEGEEITKDEFEQIYTAQFQQSAMMQQMSGEEVDQDALKQQVVDGLVSEKLLVLEAENRGMEASEEEVDEVISQLVESNDMESEDELLSAMEESGMSEEDLRAELGNQLRAQQLISEEAGDTEPTEEEMQEIYDQQIAAREEAESEEGEETEAPEFEEVKPQIEQQLVREKEAEAAQTLADELREDADVTVNI